MLKVSLALVATLFALPVSATPRAVDNGLMVVVPNIGLSRVETLTHCLNDAGVDKYQDLATDSEFQGFEACMIEHT